MLLNQFFKNAPEIEINQLSCDSRMPMHDCIFFCVRGLKDDGHDFIDEAIENGARVIVHEKDVDVSQKAIYIKVNNVLDVLNQVAAKFYNYPARDIETIVVAGCEGRVSICHNLVTMISQYRACGLINSTGIRYGTTSFLSTTPTLTILENQRHLASMKEDDIHSCVFEGSAMAFDQKKLDAVDLDAFIYSNTNFESSEYRESDHDYLDSLIAYLQRLPEKTEIILNRDDLYYKELNGACFGACTSFGFHEEADFKASNVKVKKNGTSFDLYCFGKEYNILTPLLGKENVLNLLASIAALAHLGYPIDEIINASKTMTAAEGFMEKIDCGQNYQVIVDHAATHSTLNKAIDYAKEVTDIKHKIVVVYGMNGYTSDERKIKMGEYLDQNVDLIILTENDAYDYTAFQISDMIAKGIKNTPNVIVENREDAIISAIELLNSNDTLMILGKGNQKYLLRSLGKESYPGDSALAKKYISKRMEEENEVSEIY